MTIMEGPSLVIATEELNEFKNQKKFLGEGGPRV